MKKIHYSWIMLVLGVIPVAASYGMVLNTANLFLLEVCNTYEISRASFSVNFTIMGLSIMFMAPVVGKMLKKIQVKRTFLLGEIIVSLGCLCYYLAPNIFFFYCGTIIIGCGLSMISGISISVLINQWFADKSGMALGIAMAGTGLGGMIFNQLAAFTIEYYGWKTTYAYYAAVAMVMTIIIALSIFDRPEDKGLTPFGFQGTRKKEHTPLYAGILLVEARRTRSYRKMLCGMSLLGFVLMGVYANIPTYLMDIGYSYSTTATVMSLLLGLMMMGKVGIGSLYDRFGHKTMINLLWSMMVGSIVMLYFVENMYFLVLFTFFFGLMMGGVGDILLPLLVGEIFGGKDYTSIYSRMVLLTGVVNSLGGVISNLIYEMMGSYRPIWGLFLIILLILFAVFRGIKIEYVIDE